MGAKFITSVSIGLCAKAVDAREDMMIARNQQFSIRVKEIGTTIEPKDPG